jgi:hypothetical protein
MLIRLFFWLCINFWCFLSCRWVTLTLIESHMAMYLASDSVSPSKPFSFHIRVQNFEFSLSLNYNWVFTSDTSSHRLILSCYFFWASTGNCPNFRNSTVSRFLAPPFQRALLPIYIIVLTESVSCLYARRRANTIYCWNVRKGRGGDRSFWIAINEEVALTVKNAAEKRKLGTFAYQIK